MFRICKTAWSQCVPAGTSAPLPSPSAHAASARVVTPVRLAGATRGKKAAKGASISPAHFIPQDITGNSWRSRSVLFCAKRAPWKPWLVSPGAAGTSSRRLQREAARGSHARRGSGRRRAGWAPHTDSSVESSKGLMYSKPSNSDWSIRLMTSSSSGVSCTGSLVNCVSKLSSP